MKVGGFKSRHEKFGYMIPGFIIGKEYATTNNNHRFLQLAIGGPGALVIHDQKYRWRSGRYRSVQFEYLGSITVTYGFSF